MCDITMSSILIVPEGMEDFTIFSIVGDNIDKIVLPQSSDH